MSRHNITEYDMQRVERKLNSVLNEKLSCRVETYTQQKIKNLHTLLDEVEKEDSKAEYMYTDDNASQFTYQNSMQQGSKDNTFYNPKKHEKPSNQTKHLEEELYEKEKEYMKKVSETKSTIANLKLEVKTANDTIEVIKKKMLGERETFKTKEEEMNAKVDQVKSEYEQEYGNSLERQQNLIESLLGNKKDLTEQCNSLMEQVKIMDQKSGRVVQDMREKFQKEMKQAKEKWAATEKSKREKWIADKSKELKDNTIKGLEPEIERILAKSREEKRKLETEYNEKNKTVKSDLEQTYEDKFRTFKEKLMSDNEEILNKERNFMQEGYKQQEVLQRTNNIDEVKKLKERQGNELDRLENVHNKEVGYINEKLRFLQDENLNAMKRTKNNCNEDIEEFKKRHLGEIEETKQKLNKEKEVYLANKSKELKMEFENKYNEMKKKMLEDRDKQIKKIIEKVSEENMQKSMDIRGRIDEKVTIARKDLEKELQQAKLENQILKDRLDNMQRVIDNYEKEILDFNDIAQNYDEKIFNKDQYIKDLKHDLQEKDNRIHALEEQIKIKDIRLQEQIKSERQERDRLVKELMDKEVTIRQEYEMEIKAQEDKHCIELSTFEDRIKRILMKKESEIARLSEDVQIKDNLCRKYEELLEKQKNELFSNY